MHNRSAIRVRYLPATDTKGTRLSVTGELGRVTTPLDYGAENPEAVAAQVWLDKFVNPAYEAKVRPEGLEFRGDYFFTWDLTL